MVCEILHYDGKLELTYDYPKNSNENKSVVSIPYALRASVLRHLYDQRRKMNKIKSDFIGDFKLGDNIVSNFSCLKVLYELKAPDSFCVKKPIVIIIASIAEAVLYDFYARMRGFTREGVDTVPDSVLEDVRSKHIDEFAKYIDHAKSKKLLGEGEAIYDDLHTLRKLRNRIHIQNTKRQFAPHEGSVFTSERQVFAEKTLERMLRFLSANTIVQRTLVVLRHLFYRGRLTKKLNQSS